MSVSDRPNNGGPITIDCKLRSANYNLVLLLRVFGLFRIRRLYRRRNGRPDCSVRPRFDAVGWEYGGGAVDDLRTYLDALKMPDGRHGWRAAIDVVADASAQASIRSARWSIRALGSIRLPVTYFAYMLAFEFSLYTKGAVLGYTRGKRSQSCNNSLIKLEGVHAKEDTTHYLGKRVAYVYRAQRAVKGSKIRCIWGRVRDLIRKFD